MVEWVGSWNSYLWFDIILLTFRQVPGLRAVSSRKKKRTPPNAPERTCPSIIERVTAQRERRLQNYHAHPELDDEQQPQVEDNMDADEDGTPIVVRRRKRPHNEDASEDGVEREKEVPVGSESQRRQVAGSLSRWNDEPGQSSGEEPEPQELESEDDREVAHRQVAEPAQLAKQQLAKVILKLSAPSQSNVACALDGQSSVTVDKHSVSLGFILVLILIFRVS